MAFQWTDLTIPMHNGMTVWPGDTPFSMDPEARIADGGEVNVSKLTLTTHTGTHVDAPWHFEDDGKKLDELPTDVFFGEASVVEAMNVDVVSAADLGPSPLPSRLLVKTRNSAIPVNAPFQEDFVALDSSAAQRCVDEGVRLVGVDYLSVEPFNQPTESTHHILLQDNVLIVEGLLLHKLTPGRCQFVVLPLNLTASDGAPCRAFAGMELA